MPLQDFGPEDLADTVQQGAFKLKAAATSFRRMFITRAIEKGIDVKVIAEWQGHRDGGKLILDTYSHVNRTHSQRMAQLMDEPDAQNVVPIQAGVAA